MNAATYDLDLAVIGGGASGFFSAIQYAELAPGKRVAIFEKGSRYLQKVRISGGGRCNVTHACFDPRELAKNYPRGSRELLAAFHRWQPSDTVEWFGRFGVALKTEGDGRMFPTTDNSDTIIQCFLDRARECGIALHPQCPLTGIEQLDHGGFLLRFENRGEPVQARSVCMAVGSLKGSPMLQALQRLGLMIESPVPSLFAFDVRDARISGLAGVSHESAAVQSAGSGIPQRGPLLITHKGFSGPAILRLSAWQAREMADANHQFVFFIDWLPEMDREALQSRFSENRRTQGAKWVSNTPIPPIPRRLWERIVTSAGIRDGMTWGQVPKAAANELMERLKSERFEATGKTTHKDEFVTAGGIDRKTIDFRTMQSRVVPGLYFTGECIDLDGITGGFNFQAAWTTAHIAASAIAGDGS